eukprot:3521524-Ditylum_brightwellii.AAC.1
MEVDASLVLATKVYEEHGLMIKKEQCGGLLPLHIPELGWLADLTHQTKVVAKQFFEMQKRER